MLNKQIAQLTVVACFLLTPHSEGADVIAGRTNVLLDLPTLSSAANLNLSGVGGPVIAPGALGDASVAFPINSRSAIAPDLATTFSYDPTDFLGTFSGTIEHSGTVLFNENTIEVGNFTIGFDANRTTPGASGFFVESTTGLEQILFDIGSPVPSIDVSFLTISGDLLVSPEFAQDLLNLNLASSDLTGADVGDATVSASVPEPTAISLLLVSLATIGLRPRKR